MSKVVDLIVEKVKEGEFVICIVEFVLGELGFYV